ncbi:MAG: S9 family peptidase, partial [Thermoanaerobaculia bacterium]|nr:S9 family peptidase [Thermoanaerobaculia bacterium]
PDGRTFAYFAMARPGYEADRYRILLREGLDGAERELAADWDRSPHEILWSRDGKTIYATAQDVGQSSLFAIDVASGAVRALDAAGTNQSPFLLAAGRVGYTKDHLRGPVDLWSIDADGSDPMRLTRSNDARVKATRMGEPEQMSFRGAGGDTVWAWIVKPIDFDARQKYPVAFLVHGGPQGSFGNSFHYRWNPQVYAARGYAVVMIDFHGSTGYGQAFTDAIRGDWGGKPLEDLKLGLDAALTAYPWMDGQRVAALGASYGGWMMNWIAGNWPDRFRCLVNHDGFLDSKNSYFTTEELWFAEWEFLGTPWDDAAVFDQWNPIDHVDKWRTPMLVVHGGKDFRVVETDGLATFNALQRRGIPSKLLYFPDENHWVLKPANSILWHDTVLDWIDQWTKGERAN